MKKSETVYIVVKPSQSQLEGLVLALVFKLDASHPRISSQVWPVLVQITQIVYRSS